MKNKTKLEGAKIARGNILREPFYSLTNIGFISPQLRNKYTPTTPKTSFLTQITKDFL